MTVSEKHRFIEASDFVGVKSFKAKGKRLTTYSVDRIEELEPTRMPEPEILEEDDDNDSVDTNVPEEEEENGQMKLF
mgnify:CR=1 FL=1